MRKSKRFFNESGKWAFRSSLVFAFLKLLAITFPMWGSESLPQESDLIKIEGVIEKLNFVKGYRTTPRLAIEVNSNQVAALYQIILANGKLIKTLRDSLAVKDKITISIDHNSTDKTPIRIWELRKDHEILLPYEIATNNDKWKRDRLHQMSHFVLVITIFLSLVTGFNHFQKRRKKK